VSFFEDNPQFVETKTDKQVEKEQAIAASMALSQKIMDDSLIGECKECGAITVALLGFCDPCMDEWEKSGKPEL